jgi:uncharacterized OB-fold protein
MSVAPSSPVADLGADAAEVVDTPEGVQLHGTRCRGCSAASFPGRFVCYRCGSRDLVPAPVGGSGTLYSWTTMHVSASQPVPYTVGYVDFAHDVRAFGHLATDRAWQIGDPVEVARTPGGWVFAHPGGTS